MVEVKEVSLVDSVKSKIHEIRGVRVILDSDLAKMYGVKAIRLREQVKRNLDRFPKDFMFKLMDEEVDFMVSQNAIPSRKNLGGYLPYVFTEQGVAMLSSVLRSSKAVQVNIQVMRAFVSMKKYINSNIYVFDRLNYIEKRQLSYEIKTDSQIEQVFKLIEDKDLRPSKGIFFDGQIFMEIGLFPDAESEDSAFDAYKFVADVVRSARKSIILIDNYIDDTVLTLFSKRKKGVDVVIYSKNVSKKLKLDVEKYNSQYEKVIVKEFSASHDRFMETIVSRRRIENSAFMIIDGVCVYHIGASLKDLGKKWFAFSKFDVLAFELLDRLGSSSGKELLSSFSKDFQEGILAEGKKKEWEKWHKQMKKRGKEKAKSLM